MTAHPASPRKPHRRPAVVALAGWALAAGLAPAAPPQVLAPADGAVLRTNAPTLAWRAPAAEHVEIWLDGRLAERLPGSVERYVPFPLSFGEHRWSIVVEQAGTRATSPDARFTIDDAPLAPLPAGARLLRHHWRVQSSITAGRDGAALSTIPPAVGAEGWCETSLPATALTALARAGVYPNPYFGTNNLRIPDANDAFNRKHDLLRFSHIPGRNPWAQPYWFLNTFTLPADYAGKRVWLNFGEINYRAEIWLNGTRLATALDVVGMERSFRFEITAALRPSGPNHLAVAIHPVDVPGEPAAPPSTPLAEPGRNMGEDGMIAVTYSRWDTIGWDWLPEVHDRDMGITEDVYLSASGDVEIAEVQIAPELTLGAQPQAELQLDIDLANAGSRPMPGLLTGTITDPTGDKVAFSHPCVLPAATTTTLHLGAAQVPALRLAAPHLWWPAGSGDQPLYRIDLAFAAAHGPAATFTDTFGIRKVETFLRDGNRVFRINGREIYLNGGNWVNDILFTWTATRLARELELARHANLNCLRVWGPNGVPPRVFFDAADRHGILIWQDFLHDHWGTFNNHPGYEPYLNLFVDATTAIIKRLRNHPSLFLWCGGNEGPNPRGDLIAGELLPALDRQRRHYLTASLADGVHGGGPYHNLPPGEYFTHPKLTGFNSEVGPSGVPEWESLQKFLTIPSPDWAEGRFPLSGEWAYHDATDQPGSDDRKFSTYDSLLRRCYGAPLGTSRETMREYALKTQMVTCDAYRSAVEALNRQLWTGSTGFALWKFNGAWPSLTWQITDWYMQANSGFYAVRRACEPVHIQYNRDTRRLALINRRPDLVAGVRIRAELQDMAGGRLWSHEERLDLPGSAALETAVAVPAAPGIRVLRLLALDAAGATLSSNFYWLSETDDFTALGTLAPATLTVSAERIPGRPAVRVTVRNPGAVPALLVRLQLQERTSGLEVLPTAWSDNYVGLLGGETLELEAATAPEDFPADPIVHAAGFNTAAAVDCPVAPSR